MLRVLSLALFASLVAVGMAQHKDKSTHHAAMHAEHWVKNHASAPHKKKHHYPVRGKKDKSTHHAAMHAEHWLKHHASAPHKPKP